MISDRLNEDLKTNFFKPRVKHRFISRNHTSKLNLESSPVVSPASNFKDKFDILKYIKQNNKDMPIQLIQHTHTKTMWVRCEPEGEIKNFKTDHSHN